MFGKKAAGGKRFNVFQNGYLFGAVSLPVKTAGANGQIKAGYCAGFEGTVNINETWGVVTHFSANAHQVDITQSQLKGTALTYWVMPGALFRYSFTDTRTDYFGVYAMAMAGVQVYKPSKPINMTGSSGSFSAGMGIGITYNFIRLGIKYIIANNKFEYTIYPNDYMTKLRSSFIQISLGYNFDFYPRRKPK